MLKLRSAFFDPASSAITVHGSSNAAGFASVHAEIAPGTLVDATSFSTLRKSAGGCDELMLEATIPIPDQPKTVRLVVVDEDGGRHEATTVVARRHLSRLESLVYDTESRQLRFSGYLLSQVQVRGLFVDIPGRDPQRVTRDSLPRDDAFLAHPRFNNRFSGFEARIDQVSIGDLRNATLRIAFADGFESSEPIPTARMRRDVPAGAIDAAEADYLADTVTVSGWYRSKSAITGIHVLVDTQRLHGLPVIADDAAVMKREGYRGTPVRRFTVTGRLSDSFSEPQAIENNIGNTIITVEVLHQGKKILSLEESVAAFQRRATISLVEYMRKSSTLVVRGVQGGSMQPTHARLWRGGVAIGEPVAVDPILEHEGETAVLDWSAAFLVNSVVPTTDRIGIDLYQGGQLLQHIAPEPRQVVQYASETIVEAPDSAGLARAMFAHYTTRRASPRPTIMVVFPGPIGQQTTGAVYRVRSLLRYLSSVGYRIVMVDRSEFGSAFSDRELPSDLASFIDLHIRVPRGHKRDLVELAVEELKPRPSLQGYETQLLAQLQKALSGGRLETGGSAAIHPKMDSQFNYFAAYLASLHRPNAVVGVFAWSAEAFRVLPPGTVRVIDTHDVQHVRHQVFTDAVAKYGAAAVGDISRLACTAEDEGRVLTRGDVVIAISQSEADSLGNLVGPHRVVTARIGADTITELPPVSDNRMLFVGNRYEPNIHGIRHFIDRVLPEIRQGVPDARLMVAGRVCETLTDCGDVLGLELLGLVPDLADLYRQAALIVNPVQFGTGTSVKTIEAMSYGKCLVITPEMAEAYGDADACGALVRRPIDGFAATCRELLQDFDKRRKIEMKAIEFSRTRLSAEEAYRNLLNMLESKLFGL